MLKRIDQSQFLIRFLQRISTLLAKQRGLPLLLGISFVLLSFLLDLILLAAPSTGLALAQTICHHLGLLLALIGILLSYPLAE